LTGRGANLHNDARSDIGYDGYCRDANQ
jgi:hypothetical protein